MFGRKLPHLSPYIRFALHIPDYTKCHHVVISHDESHSLMSSNLVRTDQEIFFYHLQCSPSWFSKHRIVLSLCSAPPSPLREGGSVHRLIVLDLLPSPPSSPTSLRQQNIHQHQA